MLSRRSARPSCACRRSSRTPFPSSRLPFRLVLLLVSHCSCGCCCWRTTTICIPFTSRAMYLLSSPTRLRRRHSIRRLLYTAYKEEMADITYTTKVPKHPMPLQNPVVSKQFEFESYERHSYAWKNHSVDKQCAASRWNPGISVGEPRASEHDGDHSRGSRFWWLFNPLALPKWRSIGKTTGWITETSRALCLMRQWSGSFEWLRKRWSGSLAWLRKRWLLYWNKWSDGSAYSRRLHGGRQLFKGHGRDAFCRPVPREERLLRCLYAFLASCSLRFVWRWMRGSGCVGDKATIPWLWPPLACLDIVRVKTGISPHMMIRWRGFRP